MYLNVTANNRETGINADYSEVGPIISLNNNT
jgi:hypothetical protein